MIGSSNLPREMELMKMEPAHHYHEDERIRVLYEASYKGCVSTLDTLIHQDPLILYRINPRTILIETPLHISALLGHLEFTKALLTHNSKLALEFDSFQSTPLHLASAQGHIDIVKHLLLYCKEACLVRDKEGGIPLHYAVIRGRLEVVKELIRVKPETLRILDKGKTIFHLCVMYNHLEIMKALIELASDDTYELLIERDLDGMTILHLAVMLKQVESVRYLMSIPIIKQASNLKNNMGYTVQDIFQRIPQDFKCLAMQIILMNSGIKLENGGMNTPDEVMTPNTNVVGRQEARHRRSVLKHMGQWFKYNDNWLEDMRGSLSLVATVISTITFQAVFNPPGNVIQQGILVSSKESAPLGCLPLNESQACPGEAILASRYPDYFQAFIFCNTISFVLSFCIALLLVSGIPLRNKVIMWILCLAMCTALTFLASAYFIALYMISPHKLWFTSITGLPNISNWIWTGLLVLIIIYIIIHFVTWLVKINKHDRMRGTETETAPALI